VDEWVCQRFTSASQPKSVETNYWLPLSARLARRSRTCAFSSSFLVFKWRNKIGM
jgi:hypothetical protein